MRTTESIRSEIAALVDEFAGLTYAPTDFKPGQTAVPPAGKLLGAAELKNMVTASLDGWLTAGHFNEAFEKKLAAYLGVDHLITVNSGSSANLLAFSALTSARLGARAIKPGDEVIGVAAGFPTTVNPILQFGAVPVFVDVERETFHPRQIVHQQHAAEPARVVKAQLFARGQTQPDVIVLFPVGGGIDNAQPARHPQV